MKLKIRVALMQGRKAGIKSKYPEEAFWQVIPFKWQPLRRLILTNAVKKKKKRFH